MQAACFFALVLLFGVLLLSGGAVLPTVSAFTVDQKAHFGSDGFLAAHQLRSAGAVQLVDIAFRDAPNNEIIALAHVGDTSTVYPPFHFSKNHVLHEASSALLTLKLHPENNHFEEASLLQPLSDVLKLTSFVVASSSRVLTGGSSSSGSIELFTGITPATPTTLVIEATFTDLPTRSAAWDLTTAFQIGFGQVANLRLGKLAGKRVVAFIISSPLTTVTVSDFNVPIPGSSLVSVTSSTRNLVVLKVGSLGSAVSVGGVLPRFSPTVTSGSVNTFSMSIAATTNKVVLAYAFSDAVVVIPCYSLALGVPEGFAVVILDSTLTCIAGSAHSRTSGTSSPTLTVQGSVLFSDEQFVAIWGQHIGNAFAGILPLVPTGMTAGFVCIADVGTAGIEACKQFLPTGDSSTVEITSVTPTPDQGDLFVTMGYRILTTGTSSLVLEYLDGQLLTLQASVPTFGIYITGVLSSSELKWSKIRVHNSEQLRFTSPLYLGTGRAQGNFIMGYTGKGNPGNVLDPLVFSELTTPPQDYSYLTVHAALPTKWFPPELPDTDSDSIPDVFDNCPTMPNPNQAPGAHGSGRGQRCDVQSCPSPFTSPPPLTSPLRVTVNGAQTVATAFAKYGDAFLAAGLIEGSPIFDPPQVELIPIASGSTAYLIEYSSAGNPEWAIGLEGIINDIYFDGERLFVAGSYLECQALNLPSRLELTAFVAELHIDPVPPNYRVWATVFRMDGPAAESEAFRVHPILNARAVDQLGVFLSFEDISTQNITVETLGLFTEDVVLYSNSFPGVFFFQLHASPSAGFSQLLESQLQFITNDSLVEYMSSAGDEFFVNLALLKVSPWPLQVHIVSDQAPVFLMVLSASARDLLRISLVEGGLPIVTSLLTSAEGKDDPQRMALAVGVPGSLYTVFYYDSGAYNIKEYEPRTSSWQEFTLPPLGANSAILSTEPQLSVGSGSLSGQLFVAVPVKPNGPMPIGEPLIHGDSTLILAYQTSFQRRFTGGFGFSGQYMSGFMSEVSYTVKAMVAGLSSLNVWLSTSSNAPTYPPPYCTGFSQRESQLWPIVFTPNAFFPLDTDADCFPDTCDNCPVIYNPAQQNEDGDALGDECDLCRFVYNLDAQDNFDSDDDGAGQVCDVCLGFQNPSQLDGDSDGIGDSCDNCQDDYNADQANGGAVGVRCDATFCPDGFLWDRASLQPGPGGIVASGSALALSVIDGSAQYVHYSSFDENGITLQNAFPATAFSSFYVQSLAISGSAPHEILVGGAHSESSLPGSICTGLSSVIDTTAIVCRWIPGSAPSGYEAVGKSVVQALATSPTAGLFAVAGTSGSNALFNPPKRAGDIPLEFKGVNTRFVFVTLYQSYGPTQAFGIACPAGSTSFMAFATVNTAAAPTAGFQFAVAVGVSNPEHVDVVVPDGLSSAQLSFPSTQQATTSHALLMLATASTMPSPTALNSWVSYLSCTGAMKVIQLFSDDSSPLFRRRMLVNGYCSGSLYYNGEDLILDANQVGDTVGFLCQVDKADGTLLRRRDNRPNCISLQLQSGLGLYLSDMQATRLSVMATLHVLFANGQPLGTAYDVPSLPGQSFRFDGHDTHVIDIRLEDGSISPMSLVKLLGRGGTANPTAPAFALHRGDFSWTSFTSGTTTFAAIPANTYAPLPLRNVALGAGVITHHRVLRGPYPWAENYTVSHLSPVCDLCPADALKTSPGLCGCNVVETGDSDGDGTPDCLDGCPLDIGKTAPGVCGCGRSDSGGASADPDSDGRPNCLDGCPNDANKGAPGVCGCGVSDNDSDSDGTPDCVDGCPSDTDKTAPLLCGCGVSDRDSDNDGTPDCNDQCPYSPIKIAPQVCGCNRTDSDFDSDGVLDCDDPCPFTPGINCTSGSVLIITTGGGGGNSGSSSSDSDSGRTDGNGNTIVTQVEIGSRPDSVLVVGISSGDEEDDGDLISPQEEVDRMTVLSGPIEEFTPSGEVVHVMDFGELTWNLDQLTTDAFLNVNHSSFAYVAGFGVAPPTSVRVMQYVFFRRHLHVQHGTSAYMTPGDSKLGLEVTDWPFLSEENRLRVYITYSTNRTLDTNKDDDPCDSNEVDPTLVRNLTGVPAELSENFVNIDLDSRSGITFRIGLSNVSVTDGQLVPIDYLAYSNGSVLLMFDSFVGTLGYDPSLSALFGGDENECDDVNILLRYILPASFFGGMLVVAILLILLALYNPRIQRLVFGAEGFRIENLRETRSQETKRLSSMKRASSMAANL